ncbi:hypothetical protein FAZ69_03455 [Trinickia terrae]|uniref:Uncharacterized protein n=1 Tax=Trinickia terrae TaxID=2571161 RepID=A0A4U1ICZ7_9BURK|nr:hypothetical protein [Trinickia terrae]TKC91523.1 hypothetical protein FAZ69_03455 [Trinickia terrae]
MSLRIHSPAAPPVDDSASSQDTPGTPAAHGHHRHHEHARAQLRKSANRQRAKKRRGADSQDGIDESGASEELLMMLEEHLQRNAEMVMRVGERRNGERGNTGGQQQSDGERDTASAGLSPRRPRLSRSAAKADDVDNVDQARLEAEAALLGARTARAAAKPAGSSTYEVLAVMRDFLSLPSPAMHAAGALALVRARLIEAVDAPAGRAPLQQQSMNLLLPLMMLNLKRMRTDKERALALAKIHSLLGHRRAAPAA